MPSLKPGTLLFRVTVPLCVLGGLIGLAWPEQMASAANGVNEAAFGALDWFFLLSTTILLLACVWLAFSRFGAIRLGGPDEAPEFGLVSWLAMLFAAGMGAGLLFWGVAEPLMHFGTPPGGHGGTATAARQAMVITNLHWGFHAWGIYAAAALILAYFGFRKNAGVMPSAPIRAVFRGRWVEGTARAADTIAIFAVAFGVAGSIAMGVLQLQTGLGVASGWDVDGATVRIGILVLLFVAYMTSAATSLDKGIRILSNLNMGLALAMLAFVLVAGPTADLMRGFVTSVGDYFVALPALSTGTYPFAHEELGSWFHGWTITYLVWWIAWAPFVGIFIARISRGRTIREFVFGVVAAPSAFSILWFSVFGGTALHEEFTTGGLATVVNENVTLALFTLFERLPMSGLLSVVALFLIFVFLITSADSATYVLGMLTNGGEDPPTRRKLAWGICLAVMGSALALSGDVEVVRAVTILGALPFTLVLLLQLAALVRALRGEPKHG